MQQEHPHPTYTFGDPMQQEHPHPTRKDSTDSAIELFELADKMGKSKGSKKKEEKKDVKKEIKKAEKKTTEVIVDEPEEDFLAEEDGVTDVNDLW